MSFSLQAFKSDTLAADITDSATSMTLSTGSFGSPTGEQMLVIDYDIAAKREIVKCTIDGTAVTSMKRAQDGTAAVAHTSGAKIIMAFVPSHYTGLTDGTALAAGAITDTKLATKLKAGWDLLSASGTRVSATQFTVTGDITDRLWVGKPVEFTDTTTKYGNITSFSYSSPNTTINLAANSDYALVGNPTDIYGGLHSSPVGFPTWFKYTTTITPGGSMTYGSVTQSFEFSMVGANVLLQGYITGTVAGTPNADIKFSLPVNADDTPTVQALSVRINDAGVTGLGGSAWIAGADAGNVNIRRYNAAAYTAGTVVFVVGGVYKAAA